MTAFSYVNGRYGRPDELGVSIEDRGFQFADGVYEVLAFLNGRFIDWDKHMWRLRRGLAALFLEGVPDDAVLAAIARQLLQRARLSDGTLYLQVSRGAAPRGHSFPPAIAPTVVLTARRFDFHQRRRQLADGVGAILLPDLRWARSDLKTTGLLAAVLAKEEARRAGAAEAILHHDGVVSEGGSSNLYLVDGEGRIVTHPLSAAILPGVTRDTLLALARANGLAVVERPFTTDDIANAAELFLSSTTSFLLPVVRIDGRPVANGRPGPVALRLGGLMWAEVRRQTEWRG